MSKTVDGVPRALSKFRCIAARVQIERHTANQVIAGHKAPVNPHALPGDRSALRGIPVVGVPGGYSGTVRGTDPLLAVLHL